MDGSTETAREKIAGKQRNRERWLVFNAQSVTTVMLERETDRQTDEQTDRESGRQTVRQLNHDTGMREEE